MNVMADSVLMECLRWPMMSHSYAGMKKQWWWNDLVWKEKYNWPM